MNTIQTVSVIGAGDMGHGIAECALLAGFPVRLYDVKPEYVERGMAGITRSLDKFLSKGAITREEYESMLEGQLEPTTDFPEAVHDADLVIEAVPEKIEIKKDVFARAEQHAPPAAVLASNTSSIPISLIAGAVRQPERVLGLHFFNPVVLMKLVEVIKGEKTSEEAMRLAMDFSVVIKKVPVRVEKDVPGFIFNRVLSLGILLQSCLLDEGLESPAAVDAGFRRDGAPMGPFETLDFTGLDVNFHFLSFLAGAVHPDYAPGRVLSAKVQAGECGKKSGLGIFDWSQGRPVIDLNATASISPADFTALEVNAGAYLLDHGVCSAADVDTAVIHGAGRKEGPFAAAKKLPPGEITARLEKLFKRFAKEVFRPAARVVS